MIDYYPDNMISLQNVSNSQIQKCLKKIKKLMLQKSLSIISENFYSQYQYNLTQIK